MSITTFFFILAAVLLTVFFLPDLLPRCINCKKYKFRAAFKIHKTTGIGFGYSSSKSVCRKCCRKYDIENLQDYKRVEDVKHKVERKVRRQI